MYFSLQGDAGEPGPKGSVSFSLTLQREIQILNDNSVSTEVQMMNKYNLLEIKDASQFINNEQT